MMKIYLTFLTQKNTPASVDPFQVGNYKIDFPTMGTLCPIDDNLKETMCPQTIKFETSVYMSCIHVSGSRSRPRCQTNVATSQEKQLVGEMCHRYTTHVYPS